MLQVKVADLINENRRLKRRLTRKDESQSSDDSLCREDISFVNNMWPMSNNKTLKRMASTPGMSSVKKRLRKLTNIRIREERLFMDDEDLVPEFGEKVISFVLDNDNSFECPDKNKEGVRYRRDTLEVLREKFMCETMIECSERSFGRYVPDNILKPKPEDWAPAFAKCA